MKKFLKKNIFHIVEIVLLMLICVLLLIGLDIKFKCSFNSVLGVLTLVVSISAVVFSLITHRSIVNRDKRINTISELSKIRAKYPNLSSCKMAECKTYKELNEKRKAYLKEMEFFCIGINENIYDYEIVKRMSGHFLAKQYDNYMRKFAHKRIKKGFEYSDYLIVMDKLYYYYKGEEVE